MLVTTTKTTEMINTLNYIKMYTKLALHSNLVNVEIFMRLQTIWESKNVVE